MGQTSLFGAIQKWFEDKGFEVLVTGGSRDFVISISDLFSGGFKIPDLVGVNHNNRVAIVEVEEKPDKFFDALGRCLLWRCKASIVYLAFPEKTCPKAVFLDRTGIGLVKVNENGAVYEIISMFEKEPKRINVPKFGATELHPTDSAKEMQLAEYIRQTIRKISQ